MPRVQRVDQRDQLGALGLRGQHAQQPLARARGRAGTAPAAACAPAAPARRGCRAAGRCRRGARRADPTSRSTIAVTAAGVFSVSRSPGCSHTTSKSQLPQLGFAEQPGVGLDRQQQAVFAQQRAGERVVGADGDRSSATPRSPPPGTRPAPARRASRVRTRRSSWPAALRVNVSPSTCPGSAYPLATSQTTRAAIVSVLPAPAPAMTTSGPGGAAITAACSSVGGKARARRPVRSGL